MKSDIKGKVSAIIKVSSDKVWDALTKPEIIKQYFFNTNTETDWQPGSPIKFTGEWQGKTYEDKGTVLENVPGKRIKYSYWSSMSGIEDKPENYADITYTIESQGTDQTGVVIQQENIPDEKMKIHSEENWNMVLKNMKSLLEKKSQLEEI